ncbi:polysaccharide deacetylase family protein [Streptomyces sp. NPDC001663]|uniref:polysaccharide deacetylase family protein n=1 Tax=Streptomyces sp. NPDC001663 TaxID=3364597 RepID=UPI00367EE873
MEWLKDAGVPWPDGARAAACISWDCDGDATAQLSWPDDVNGHAFTTSWMQHDRVAIPRIVDMYEYYGIKQTFFVPAWCIEEYPKVFETVVANGHEIGMHGYLHEGASHQSAEGELFWMRRCADIIEKFSGRRPVGNRSPGGLMSEKTYDYLVQEGFLYDSTLMHDNFPYVLATSAGNILELQSDLMANDDWVQYAHVWDLQFMMQPRSPQEAGAVYLAEFEAAYASGSAWIASFHAQISGRLARLTQVGRIIEHIQAKGDVWMATMEEIALHVNKCISDGSWKPRVVDMPLYPKGRIPALRPGFVPDEVALRVTPPIPWTD